LNGYKINIIAFSLFFVLIIISLVINEFKIIIDEKNIKPNISSIILTQTILVLL
jgi:hypothetical protein